MNEMSARALNMEELENVNGGYYGIRGNDEIQAGKCQFDVRVK